MKPLKETKIGEWIKKNAPDLIDTIDDFVPAPVKGGLNLIKKLIEGKSDLSPDQKEEFNKLLADHELEMLKEQNRTGEENEEQLTKRHEIDMTSDSKLSKNIRPGSLIWFHLIIAVLCILDSCNVLKIKDAWVTLYMSAYLAVLSFYFVGREIQKWKLNSAK